MIQIKNFEFWLARLTLVSFCILMLAVSFFSRKPLCIDSKVIDKINMGDKSVLYKCSFYKNAPLSGYLAEKIEVLNPALKLEKYLNTLAPFRSRLRINILPTVGTEYLLQEGELTLNKNIFETVGILEKSIVKLWLRDQNPDYFLNDLLSEEVFSDLILAIAQGYFKLEDPFSEEALSIDHQKWPTILKTVSGYCQSEWKIPEHYQMCSNLNKTQSSVGHEMIEYSLRPLLSSAWIKIYNKLNFKEKIELSRSLPLVLKTFKLHEDFYIDSLKSSELDPLLGPFLIVQRLNLFWSETRTVLSVPTYRHLLAVLATELEAKGFKEMVDVAEFDLVYQTDEILLPQSPRVKSLAQLAVKNPNLRILMRDPEKVWFMPAKEPVSNHVLKGVKSNRIVLETCRKVDFNRVLSFAQETSRLLVVRNCDLQKTLNFQNFISQGAEGFASQNQNNSFVQFHLPSVMLKKNDLFQAGDVFHFVGERKVDSPSFQSLGWRELDWNDKLKTYHPKGFVDAIELFRVFPQDNSHTVSNL